MSFWHKWTAWSQYGDNLKQIIMITLSVELQFYSIIKVFIVTDSNLWINCARVCPFWLNKLSLGSECGSGLIWSIQYHRKNTLFILLLNYYHHFQLSMHSIEAFIVCYVLLFKPTQKKINWPNIQIRTHLYFHKDTKNVV